MKSALLNNKIQHPNLKMEGNKQKANQDISQTPRSRSPTQNMEDNKKKAGNSIMKKMIKRNITTKEA